MVSRVRSLFRRISLRRRTTSTARDDAGRSKAVVLGRSCACRVGEESTDLSHEERALSNRCDEPSVGGSRARRLAAAAEGEEGAVALAGELWVTGSKTADDVRRSMGCSAGKGMPRSYEWTSFGGEDDHLPGWAGSGLRGCRPLARGRAKGKLLLLAG